MMDSSPLGLALLCGVCLAAFGPAHGVGEDVSREIRKLTDHYNVTGDKSLFGSPIFLKVINSQMYEEEEKWLFLQESLDVYVRILSDMLNRTREAEVKESLAAVRAEMEDLRDSYFPSRDHDLRSRLRELWALKTNDATVQRKAVRELESVFHSARKLGSTHAVARRRRHARPARLPRG